jgi:ring-1,2-phenylacetyl-CoA epoxidase subunit PaaD
VTGSTLTPALSRVREREPAALPRTPEWEPAAVLRSREGKSAALPPLPHAGEGWGEGDRVTRAWSVLDTVLDPEVPAVSIRDLGIVRDVIDHDDVLEIVLTPTYSGCPATEAIEHDVRRAIDAAGLGPARVSLRRAPAWTTDWISAEGRRKLLAYGIVPPGPAPAAGVPIRFFPRAAAVAALPCPRCGSAHTERLAAFGSTACKATWRCLACGEPFEHFKPI